jgi:hypothetical protein
LIEIMHYYKYLIELNHAEINVIVLIKLIIQMRALNIYLHLILCDFRILREINDHLIGLGYLYFLY